MDYVRLGKTNLMVSKLGFGGIPIQRVSEDEAVTIVKRCLELGINYLDTANGYTTSEGRIGKAISGQQEALIIATKSIARNSDEVNSHLQQSLKQLGVEYIDLYQFHNVSSMNTLDMILAPNGPMAVVQEAKKIGLVKHIGVTSHQIDVAKELIRSDRFETIMVPFNFIVCEPADELIPLAREHDVGFIAMKPLAGGMLENVTIAFKYLRQFSDVVPIVGVQKVQEIEEVVQVMEGPPQLTEAELKEMQRQREELGTRFCRRCDYCRQMGGLSTICHPSLSIRIARHLSSVKSYQSASLYQATRQFKVCIGPSNLALPESTPVASFIALELGTFPSLL